MIVAATIAAPGRGFAYVRDRTEASGTPVAWRSRQLTLTFSGPPPAGMTEVGVLAAVRGAAATWSHPAVPCSGMTIQVARDPSPEPAAANDGINHLIFRAGVWGKNGKDDVVHRYDSRALAVTTSSIRKGSEGKITDADIEINAVYFNWAAIDRDAAERRGWLPNLQATITHELGHVLGFAHTCDDGARPELTGSDGVRPPRCIGGDEQRLAKVRGTLMYPEPLRAPGEERTTLSPDEVAGVCDVYPRQPQCGGCSAPGGRVPRAAWLLILSVSAVYGRLRRQRRHIDEEFSA